MARSTYSGPAAILMALGCTGCAVFLAIWQIYAHLRNYTEPTYQRYIVRIIFMVPVYATMSFLALVFGSEAIYFNTIRDVYEAWVIYNFLSLCLAWVGGPGAVVSNLQGRLLKPSYFLFTCWLPPIPLDSRFIRKCKQGCLQFVFLKPLLAAACLLLYSYGLYKEGNFSPVQGYLYITLVYMASYTVAVYSLILFYLACKDLLKPFNPIPKFIVIKSVVVLTYWQGVLVFLFSLLGLVRSRTEAADLQNLLICVEMAVGAVGFMIAFPHKPYLEANLGGGERGGATLASSVHHALSLGDVVSDTVHQFAPTYHDYVLYSDGTEEAPRRYRTRTFVPTGQEMGTHRQAKGSFFGFGGSPDAAAIASRNASLSLSTASDLEGGRVANIAPGGGSPVLPSEHPAGGLLLDAHLTQARPYDVAPLKTDKGKSNVINDSPLRPFGSIHTPPKTSPMRTESVADSSRGSSQSDEVGEGTRLTKERRMASGGHGMLMDENDVNGENDFDAEGHIQR